MRSFIITLISAMVLATSAFAMSGEKASGVVKSYDVDKRMLVLEDGKSYYLHGDTAKMTPKAGQKVQMTYTMKNGKAMVDLLESKN